MKKQQQRTQEPPQDVAVIYARYSSSRQRDVSIDQQVSACRAYADQQGWNVIRVYADHAITGNTAQLPSFQQMIRDASALAWSKVIVYAFDRFARDRYDSAVYKHALKENGVRVLSVTEQVTDDPAGVLMESIFEGFAEYYSRELQRKIRRGLRYNAENCIASGAHTIPLGYDRGPDGRYRLNPAEAALVQEAFRRYGAGETMAAIARDFNARGITTKRGKPWSRSSFHALLKNERYAGVFIWKDVRVEGGVPVIISREDFDRVQRRIAAEAENRVDRRDRGHGLYVLTGRAVCGLCGCGLTGVSGVGRHGDRHAYYYCSGRRKGSGCELKPIPRDQLEGLVARSVLELVLTDDTIEWMAEYAAAHQRQEDTDAEISRTQDALKASKKAAGNILAAIEKGTYTDTTADRLRELEAEAESIKIDLTAESVKSPGINKEQIVFFITSFRRGDPNDPAYRSRLIDTFVNRVIVYDDRILISLNFTGENNEITAPIPDTLTGSDIDFSGGQNITTPCGVVLFWRISSSRGIRTSVKKTVRGTVFSGDRRILQSTHEQITANYFAKSETNPPKQAK